MPVYGDLPPNYNRHDEHVGYLRGQDGFDPPTTTLTTPLATTANQALASTRGHRPPPSSASTPWYSKQCIWKFCWHRMPRPGDSPYGSLAQAAALTVGGPDPNSGVSNLTRSYLPNGTPLALTGASTDNGNWVRYLPLAVPLILGGAALHRYLTANANIAPTVAALPQRGPAAEVVIPLLPESAAAMNNALPGAPQRPRAFSV
jgi:hypothetical protein